MRQLHFEGACGGGGVCGPRDLHATVQIDSLGAVVLHLLDDNSKLIYELFANLDSAKELKSVLTPNHSTLKEETK